MLCIFFAYFCIFFCILCIFLAYYAYFLHVVCIFPGRGTGAQKSCGLIDGFRYFCVIEGKPSILRKMYFFQVFLRAPWLMPAPNLVKARLKGGDYAMLQHCVWIQTPTVKRCPNSGGMERKHSVRKPRLRARIQARFTLSDWSRPIKVFWLRHHCGLQIQNAYKARVAKAWFLACCSSCWEVDISVIYGN